jgi:23S rRNA (adenine2503-C2)-methyltransferase
MSGDKLPDVRSLSREELRQFFLEKGEKKFRADQVYEWLWKRSCNSFESMTNLSRPLQQMLGDQFAFHGAVAEERVRSADGTVKVAFRLHDGLLVEGVLIPAGDRFTVCISSQVGCSLGCRFCATGQLGFKRNLTAGEIVDQVSGIQQGGSAGAVGLSNIVFMGMGEPFLNYQNVRQAINRITSPDGLGMSPQRITVSSVGIPKMIRQMADDDPKYHFAFSLHAATDEKRNRIIPFNLKHPLADITGALKYYHQKTGKRITIEYILFQKFNDSIADAKDLALFCRNFPVKINIIEYNPVSRTDFKTSSAEDTRKFVAWLETRNLVVNVRQSRGKDIDAACGQLAGKMADRQ